MGEGDTYFQQLAVLETAQQKKKKHNTKEREAEIRAGLQQLWSFTAHHDRAEQRGGGRRKAQTVSGQ